VVVKLSWSIASLTRGFPGLSSDTPRSDQAATKRSYQDGKRSLDSGGRFAPGTFEQEADRAWANITAIAAASGYTSDEFLYVQVLLADIGNYGDINDWWRRQFPDPAATPSRLTFQAGALPFGAKIELQAVAARHR
jgi:2-iminobutanoate/2-iminopropanoate deaminase